MCASARRVRWEASAEGKAAREALRAAAKSHCVTKPTGAPSNRRGRVWSACRLTRCARAFRRATTPDGRGSAQSSGFRIRRLGGTSSGASSWETRPCLP